MVTEAALPGSVSGGRNGTVVLATGEAMAVCRAVGEYTANVAATAVVRNCITTAVDAFVEALNSDASTCCVTCAKTATVDEALGVSNGVAGDVAGGRSDGRFIMSSTLDGAAKTLGAIVGPAVGG